VAEMTKAHPLRMGNTRPEMVVLNCRWDSYPDYRMGW
jgi:hypothetical protein